MAVLLGSARIDERGQAANGQAGDQNGREVCIENFYMHSLGWYCYRAKDPAVANALAEAMKQACANQHIGYDQNQRLSVINQFKKYGSLAEIAVNTECDCSSLVRACCMQAGFDPGNFTTYTEGKALEATGKFEPRFKVSSASEMCVGDIVVTCKKGHTCIVVSGKARTAEKSEGNTAYVGKGIGEGTAKEDMAVRTGGGTKYSQIGTVKKGQKVEILEKVANGWLKIVWPGAAEGYAYTSNAGGGYYRITIYGQKKTGVVVNCYSLYIRKTPGGTILDAIGAGKEVTLTGKASGIWLEISAPMDGWVSGSYIKQ